VSIQGKREEKARLTKKNSEIILVHFGTFLSTSSRSSKKERGGGEKIINPPSNLICGTIWTGARKREQQKKKRGPLYPKRNVNGGRKREKEKKVPLHDARIPVCRARKAQARCETRAIVKEREEAG